MSKNIINLEINEVSPSLISDYIKKNKKSNLAKLSNKEFLKIYTTKALDIEKDKLYPSQTWASFNTGKAYCEHKCYWYSDHLDSDELIWNKLVNKNKSVGILGSLHSSKFPVDLLKNRNYKFYLPDCFSSKNLTKPFTYESFQSLNNTLVGESTRVTGIGNLLKTLFGYLTKVLISPKKFGISFFSTKMILSIIFSSILYRNKEMLRMAQFPLISSIFIDLYIKYKPCYSTLFSNHVAGNMHRYWYAHDVSSYKNKKKYPKKWIQRNKNIISISLDLLDDFIGNILKKDEFKDSIILITSSMGQEANPKFDEKFLSEYDGKIKDINLFLEKFYCFYFEKFSEKIEFNCNRNMAPQYGFNIKNQTHQDINAIVNSLSEFISKLGLVNKVDLENGSIVLSVDPYTDMNFQKKYSLKEANCKFAGFGFQFFPIKDHHSGSHSEYGSLIAINSNEEFDKKINEYIDTKGYINYLNYSKLITEYFLNKVK